MNAHTTMQEKVTTYLQERQQAGFAMRVLGSQLRSFARFAESLGHRGPLTVDLALRWAAQASRRTQANTAAGRLAQLRPFTRFCHKLDPLSEIPPAQFFGRSYRHVTPHIYSARELRSLLAAAAQSRPAGCLRAESYATLFGLLAATGLRLSEALALECRDVDLDQGLLHIREAKFHKSRYVPLHATTTQALRRYAARRAAQAANASTRFLVADDGRPLPLTTVQSAFKRLRDKLRWHSRGGHPAPRIHDLRFTFICRRLERWYAEGADIDRVILSLYTYVGHVNVTSTYWYLTATPELMRLALRRFRRFAAGGAS
jgi:integrase